MSILELIIKISGSSQARADVKSAADEAVAGEKRVADAVVQSQATIRAERRKTAEAATQGRSTSGLASDPNAFFAQIEAAAQEEAEKAKAKKKADTDKKAKAEQARVDKDREDAAKKAGQKVADQSKGEAQAIGGYARVTQGFLRLTADVARVFGLSTAAHLEGAAAVGIRAANTLRTAQAAIAEGAEKSGGAIAGISTGAIVATGAIGLIAVAAVGAGVGLYKLANWSSETVLETVRLASAMHTTAKEFSELQYIAAIGAISNQGLTNGLKQLREWMVATGQDGKSLTQVFREQADEFAAMPEGVDKTQKAYQRFGESALEWLPVLDRGSAGIAKMQEEARKLGVSIGPEMEQSSRQFQGILGAIMNSIKGTALKGGPVAQAGLLTFFGADIAPLLAGANGLFDRITPQKKRSSGDNRKEPAVVPQASPFEQDQRRNQYYLGNLGVQAAAIQLGTDGPGARAEAMIDNLKHQSAFLLRNIESIEKEAKSTGVDLFAKDEKFIASPAVLATQEQLNKLRIERLRIEREIRDVQASAFREQLEKKDAQLDRQNREAQMVEAGLSPDGNRYLSRSEKYGSLTGINRGIISSLTQRGSLLSSRENDENTPDEEKLKLQKEMRDNEEKILQIKIKQRELDANNTFIGRLRANVRSMVDDWKAVGVTAAQVLTDIVQNGINNIASGFAHAIVVTGKWNEALRNIEVTILESIVGAIIKMAIQWVLSQIIMAAAGKALMAAAVAASAPMALASAAIWAAPATLATIATGGAAAAAAPAEILGAQFEVFATSAFAEGGIVSGPGTGTSDSILARISNGEAITMARRVNDIGPNFFNTLNKSGVIDLSAAAAGTPVRMAGAAGGGSGGGSGGNQVQIHIHHLTDPVESHKIAMANPEARHVVVDAVKGAVREIRGRS